MEKQEHVREPHVHKPGCNQINVSNKRNQNFYVYLGKQFLETHPTIEFHALGNAVSAAVMAAENLVRNNYAEMEQINTKTISLESENGESKKAKLLITLRKHKDFEENMKKFEEIKKENLTFEQKYDPKTTKQ